MSIRRGELASMFKKFFAYKPDREVQNKELVLYTAGVVGQNHTYNLITSWFLYFCTDVLYLNAGLIGLLLSIIRVWDAVNDPIVGVIIDKKKPFKSGEKLRPFLKIMAIPVGICAMLLFIDVGIPDNVLPFYLCGIYFLWDFFYSFQDIAQWSMTAMISTNSAERGRAVQFARIGGMIGGWLPGLLTIILGNVGVLGISEKTVFTIAGVLFGFGGMVMSMLTSCAKERAPVVQQQTSLKDSLKLLGSNKIVMSLVIANAISHCTLIFPGIYFFKYMVRVNMFGYEIDGLTVSFIYGLLTGLPGSLAMFFANWFSRKVGGMKKVLVIATVMNIVTRIIAFFVGFEGWGIVIVGALMALSSIPNGMTGIASTSLWGDSVDYAEWKTGQRNEGAVFAMQNLIAKLTTAIDTLFTGITLSIMKYDAKAYNAGIPPEQIFYDLAWPIYMLGPAVGSILYLIPLLMMKYDDKQRLQIEADLKIRRAGAKGVFLDKEFEKISANENLNISFY